MRKLDTLEKREPLSLTQIASILAPHAREVTPAGSSCVAVAYQWAHAIIGGDALYGGLQAADIMAVLRQTGMLRSKAQLGTILDSARAVRPLMRSRFSFIDLFAGIGGMRIGFQGAGGRCVFSSELDLRAQETYLTNHGEMPFGDITKIPPRHIPTHDVLLAGFPCQPFSHAGLKLGIEDTRGTLFYNIAQILKVKRPKFALLENVRGLISNDGGRTLQVILKALTSIGYECNIPRDVIRNGSAEQLKEAAKLMVLKSIDFGLPQNRQRIYLVLWRAGQIDHFDYPQPSGTRTRVGDILEDDPAAKHRISDRLWSGHKRRKIDNAANGKGFGYGMVTAESPYTNTISARYYKDGSEVLVNDIPGANPRKLTLREAARLQGFPESFVIHPSAVAGYRQFGNSVSVPVVQAIAMKIATAIRMRA